MSNKKTMDWIEGSRILAKEYHRTCMQPNYAYNSDCYAGNYNS